MIKVRYNLLLLAFCMLAAFEGRAQVLKNVQNAVEAYGRFNIQEKLFVQTDKSTYLPGELIWFKLYALEAGSNKPAILSRVAYVDVLDKDNKAILQAKIALKDGAGNGSFYIPVATFTGGYQLRAYTSWMKNAGPDVFFQKQVNIINPLRNPEAQAADNSTAYALQFFPEGGNMIAGIPGKVAFKAVGKDGKGISLEGEIVDQNNTTVAKFQTLKFGIGQFTFTPVAGSTYKAVARLNQNDVRVIPFPAVASAGYGLSVTDAGAGITVNIRASESTAAAYLIVHNGKEVNIAENLSISNGIASYTIEKSRLNDGVSHITVFNSNGQPVSERLYFKRPVQELTIDAATDAAVYGSRKRVNLSVNSKNESSIQQHANLSVSVYRFDSLQTAEETDIVNYMWLGAELKGNIESPDYYFINKDPKANEALDNLMLTHGWRRFKWEAAMRNKQPAYKYLPELYGHLVSGNIVAKDGTQGKGIIAYMGVPGKSVQYYSAKSDSVGRFIFNTKDLYGPGEIVVQTNNELDSNYRVQVDHPFSTEYTSNALQPFRYQPAMLGSLQKNSLSVQVQNVYSGLKNRQFILPAIDSNAFYGTYDKRYILKQYTRFTTMEEVMREYVAEVNILKRQKKFHFKVLTEQAGFLEEDPLVLVDGVPFFNIDKIMEADPLKISKLDIVRHRYFYGPVATDGILNFNTEKGDFAGIQIDPRAVVLDYEGMQVQREFYAPVYETGTFAGSRIPDFRNVLYWSPELNTNAQGKGAVSFYTSDVPGTYMGVLQGVSASGIPGKRTFIFEVR